MKHCSEYPFFRCENSWLRPRCDTDRYMRAAPKVIPPILWYWPMMSDMDVGGMAVEAEPSQEYSITFHCCVTDGSRRDSLTKWHLTFSAYEAKVCHWIPPRRKDCTHSHSLMPAEQLWKPNNGCEHSEEVYFSSDTTTDCYESSMQALFHQ